MERNRIEKFDNIILFDGSCVFCNNMIFKLNKNDKNNILRYGFLNDYQYFNKFLELNIQHTDELVFIKNQKEVYCGSKAISEILITINKFKTSIGFINFFPNLSSLIYKIVAKNRNSFFRKQCHYSKNLKSKLIKFT